MKLSVKAKPFISSRPKGSIVSWNILSTRLTDAISTSLMMKNSSETQPLFSKSFFDKRIEYIIQTISRLMTSSAGSPPPIICLQEVNDAVNEDKSLLKILTRFFQEHHYIVLSSSFGTYDPIYPELGLITAIPSMTYDVISNDIRQISVEAPNTMIRVVLRFKTSPTMFTVINTHFPAKFQDARYMRSYTQQFIEKCEISSHTMLCGDFNTSANDPWYITLRGNLQELPNQEQYITHLSIQRRDRRSSENTSFQGFLDHFFCTYDVNLSLVTRLPRRLSYDDISQLKSPLKDNPYILPSRQNPSDHVPIQTSFQLV